MVGGFLLKLEMKFGLTTANGPVQSETSHFEDRDLAITSPYIHDQIPSNPKYDARNHTRLRTKIEDIK